MSDDDETAAEVGEVHHATDAERKQEARAAFEAAYAVLKKEMPAEGDGFDMRKATQAILRAFAAARQAERETARRIASRHRGERYYGSYADIAHVVASACMCVVHGFFDSEVKECSPFAVGAEPTLAFAHACVLLRAIESLDFSVENVEVGGHASLHAEQALRALGEATEHEE